MAVSRAPFGAGRGGRPGFCVGADRPGL